MIEGQRDAKISYRNPVWPFPVKIDQSTQGSSRCTGGPIKYKYTVHFY